MRMLFVIAALRNGGAERVISALTGEFSLQNEVHIAVLEEDAGLYDFRENVKFHRLKVYTKSKIASKFRKILSLRGLFRELKPDLIISFIDWTNVACVVANLGLKFKHIATEHHSQDFLKSPKFRLVRDMSYRFVDGLSVLSQSDFLYYDFVKRRAVLHNPFFIRQNFSAQKKEKIILSVGRLEEVKGYDIYFRALARIPKEILKGWRVMIAGEGSLEAQLKKTVGELGLEVEFLGHVSDVAPLYERARVFVLSSRSEGLSNVLIEAGYFGCARVSSDTVGGCELIKNGIDGALFENSNEANLADVLQGVLDDENLQESLGRNAKEGSKEFELENIMLKWRNFIDEVVKS